MSNPEAFFEESPARADQQPSIYRERIKARSYSDQYPEPGDYLVTDAQLKEKGRYWSDRVQSPEVSKRGKEEIKNIISAIAVETWFRRDYKVRQEAADLTDFVPEQWESVGEQQGA